MFKKLIKNKKAQNTAEYAILISLVVAGIIAMQTYAQRALQAKVRDASQYLSSVEGNVLDGIQQYEPYYLNTNYTVSRAESETQRLDTNLVSQEVDTTVTRGSGGFQQSDYTVGTFIQGNEFTPVAPLGN